MRRDPYADPGQAGLDFLIDGPNGERHLEVKNLVGSKIKEAELQSFDCQKDGTKIAKRTQKQIDN